MCMEPIRLTQPSVLFGYYNHAVRRHEGYFKRDLERLVRLVGSGRLDLSRSISHVVSLEDVVRGVEQLSKKKDNPVRIVVKPGNR
jgi:threonine dehydrogenase-like Zn-dependent dehydrogenase